MPAVTLHHLPTRNAGAAENMAIDFLLLQRYPQPTHPRFRHYGWHRPAYTFGYSQKTELVKSLCPTAEVPMERCRRFTGGGIVDHRDDWTYALVIPRGHPLEKARALDSYRAVHEALACALRESGQPAETKKSCEPEPVGDASTPAAATPAGVCFRRAECFDVIQPDSGEKIAGAAQKRNKQGLILQGSLWRPAARLVRDWEEFQERLLTHLGKALEVEPVTHPWPDFNEDDVSQLTETYSSTEWNEQR